MVRKYVRGCLKQPEKKGLAKPKNVGDASKNDMFDCRMCGRTLPVEKLNRTVVKCYCKACDGN